MRCPRCSGDSLYQRWNVFKRECSNCSYGFEEREGDCWFFLYCTTAALTGLFVIAILLWRPSNLLLGQILLTAISICLIPLSLRLRKGVALAIEYLWEERGGRFLLYADTTNNDD